MLDVGNARGQPARQPQLAPPPVAAAAQVEVVAAAQEVERVLVLEDIERHRKTRGQALDQTLEWIEDLRRAHDADGPARPVILARPRDARFLAVDLHVRANLCPGARRHRCPEDPCDVREHPPDPARAHDLEGAAVLDGSHLLDKALPDRLGKPCPAGAPHERRELAVISSRG